MLLLAIEVFPQCANNNTVIAGGAITPPCPGSTTAPCVQGGQYALVNVVAGRIYTFSTCTGTTFDTQITLYPGNGGPGTNVGYNDDGCGVQSTITWTATYTGTLRVLVDQFNCQNNTICATLTIACQLPPPPITNDNPCQATALPVNSSCTMTVYTNAGATATTGVPAPSCPLSAGYAGGDVWFTAVVPSSGYLNLESATGVMTDGAMAVYTAASCTGPFTEIACDDDGGPGLMPQLNLTGLTPGQTVYIRFWEYGNNNNGTFSLCAYGPSIPAGDCYYVLNMFDSFGDGWNGSTVGVSINGGPFTNYTVTGASNVVFIGVNIGNILVIQYTENSAFPNDITYNLTLGAGSVFSDGPSPATGIVYTTVVDCIPPPAPPEDCYGGNTVCSNQAFNSNTNNTGNVVDLTPSNRGCLLSNERQGSWYHFSSSSNGNIAFTISPTGPNIDYDFAIWGPYSQVTCPPPGPPVRCSYSSQYGDTGLNYTATDNSEDQFGDKWVNDLTVLAGQVYTMYISNWSQNGVSFNLTWNLQGGSSLDCTVLPIELISFSGTRMSDHVQLDWVTATELNNDHFVIERSGNGHEFQPIGRMDGAGISMNEIHYTFKDMRPIAGINYYRLRQVDHDGGSETTSIVGVEFGAGVNEVVGWPNPVGDQFNLQFKIPASGAFTMRVHDHTARLVLEQEFDCQSTPCNYSISTKGLRAGSYNYQIMSTDGSVLLREKFVKE